MYFMKSAFFASLSRETAIYIYHSISTKVIAKYTYCQVNLAEKKQHIFT